MPTSSIDDLFTDTIWLVVAMPEDEPPQLLRVKNTELGASDAAFSLSFITSQRVIAIPYKIMLPVLVKNALEALDGD